MASNASARSRGEGGSSVSRAESLRAAMVCGSSGVSLPSRANGGCICSLDPGIAPATRPTRRARSRANADASAVKPGNTGVRALKTVAASSPTAASAQIGSSPLRTARNRRPLRLSVCKCGCSSVWRLHARYTPARKRGGRMATSTAARACAPSMSPAWWWARTNSKSSCCTRFHDRAVDSTVGRGGRTETPHAAYRLARAFRGMRGRSAAIISRAPLSSPAI